MQNRRIRFLELALASLLLLLVGSCGGTSANTSPDGGTMSTDPPCSCATGDRRCQGSSIQVCEAVSASCSSWGAAVACPTNLCTSGSCGANCQDACPAGMSRCTSETAREVCRIGASGCLEWTSQSCAAQQYCDAAQNSCVPSVPCDTTCPSGYLCKPTGVCAGGDPTMAALDVKTVQLAGRVTLNGADPVKTGTGCTNYPSQSKANIRLTEPTRNYSFLISIPCSATDFAFSATVYPGTYRVTVEGNSYAGYIYSNLPTQPYVIASRLQIP